MNTDKRRILVSDLQYDEDEVNAVTEVIRSQWLTMGPRTDEFEKAVQKYINVKHAVAVSNGTAALHLSLLAMGIGPGDEVIVTPLSFVASTNVVLYVGAKPVFVDVKADTFNIDPEKIKEKVTSKTRAIIPVHLAGLPADMDSIFEIAENHDIQVLEDAAHAIGAKYKGKKIGSFGDVTSFSFFSNKNLSVGEGGAITTNNDEIAKKLRLLRSHGLTKSTWARHHKKEEESYDQLYEMVMLGYNYRMTEINAALGLVQLKKLDTFNAQRKKLFEFYMSLTNGLPLQFQQIPDDVESSYHVLPTLFPKGLRSRVRSELTDRGIGTSIHYTPIHKFQYYQNLGYRNELLPIAEDIGSRVITLPLHQNLSDNDVEYIVENIREVLDSLL